MLRWKGKIELILIAITLAASVFGSTYLLSHQFSTEEVRVRGFYMEPKDSLDMVIIGSSAVYTTFNSSIAWKEEGFTSYALATSGAPMGLAKSMVKEVQRTQKPKLILIDLNGILYDDDAEQREGVTRLWVDNMELTENKVEAVQELTTGDEVFSWYLPIYKYHDNWEKISACLRYTSYEWKMRTGERLPYSFTMRSISGTSDRKKLIDVRNYKEKQSLYPLSGKRFRELMQYLKEQNLVNQVAFFNMPRYYDNKMLRERKLLNEAEEIATKEGFKVYDFDREIDRMNLDPNRDYYNSGHLNMDGQIKATKYIANRINQDYQLSATKHSEDLKKRWDTEYADYQKVFAYYRNNMKEGKREEITVEIIDKVLSNNKGDNNE